MPSNATSNTASGYRELPLNRLMESPHNPRRRFNEKSLAELAASIEVHGVLTPILVRPQDSDYEIAAGHRRYRAARMAGYLTVPAIVRQMTDAEFMEVLAVENLQREDVHPFEEAQGYRELMRLPGYDVAAVASKIGRSETYVRARLRLLDMANDVAEAFLADRITFAHARLIAPLPANRQSEALGACFDQYGKKQLLPAADLREWIQDGDGETLSDASFPLDDAELIPAAGACLTCPKSTCGDGKLFADADHDDLCFDQKCFEAKTTRQITRHVSAGLVAISKSWDSKSDPAGTLSREQYTHVEVPSYIEEGEEVNPNEKLCNHLENAVIVNGAQRGAVVKICRDTKCPVHGDGVNETSAASLSGSKSPKQSDPEADERRQQAKKEQADREKEWDRRRGVVDRLCAVWTPEIDIDLAYLLVMASINTAGNADVLGSLASMFGVERDGNMDAQKATLCTWAEKATAEKLRYAVIWLFFRDEIERNAWARDYDLIAIAEDRLAEQLEPKKAPKAKKAK